MIFPFVLGTDVETDARISPSPDTFRTHYHLIGGTGSGKTNTILNMLRAILSNPRPQACVFIVDPMGGLSQDLLRWIANERHCPQHVRDRLVYVEPARESVVLPFNPLLHDSQDHLYYQVGRAVEIVLRAWASQSIDEMPRLRQWTFNAFFAAAAMGYPISTCRYLLRPGTPEHESLLRRLPRDLQGMWAEILRARGNEAVRILESTRNRLAPFFDSGILRRMFGSFESRFDVRRFIEERRIVILNVASYDRLDPHIGRTIGALAINEVIRTARNLSPSLVDPTYILLDEFQHFVTPDIYDALPTVRQLGLRLILSHQSFSQLEVGDVDLTGLIWQARSRLMFANDAEDADLIAHELATLTYDPNKIKDILYSRKQRIVGHRKELLQSRSRTNTASNTIATGDQESSTNSRGRSKPRERSDREVEQQGSASGRSRSHSHSHAHSNANTEGESETLVPIHQDYWEISNKTFSDFNEQTVLWAQRMRKRRTGEAFGKFRDDEKLYDIKIDYRPIADTPAIQRRVEELLQRNFESDFFVSAARVEQESEAMRLELLREPPIIIDEGQRPAIENHASSNPLSSPVGSDSIESEETPGDEDPFRR